MDPNKLKNYELEAISVFSNSPAYKVIKKYLEREELLIHEASHNAQDIFIESKMGDTTHVMKKTRIQQIDENVGRTIQIHNFSSFINLCCKRLNKLSEKEK